MKLIFLSLLGQDDELLYDWRKMLEYGPFVFGLCTKYDSLGISKLTDLITTGLRETSWPVSPGWRWGVANRGAQGQAYLLGDNVAPGVTHQ